MTRENLTEEEIHRLILSLSRCPLISAFDPSTIRINLLKEIIAEITSGIARKDILKSLQNRLEKEEEKC